MRRPISGPNGLEGDDAMSALQIVCAVVVPLLWGYQFVVIKVGVGSFRLSSSSHCASRQSRCCSFRSSKGRGAGSSDLSQPFRFSLVD